MKRIFSAIIAILAFSGVALAQGNYQMNIITKSGKAIVIDGEDVVSVTFSKLPLVLEVASGADLSAVLEGVEDDDVTLKLEAGGEYTVGGTIAPVKNLMFMGDEAAPATITLNAGIQTVGSVTFKNVVIDASAIKVPVIQMNALPKEGLNEVGACPIDGVVVENCEVKGLAYQFFYCNKQKYLLKEIKVENSIFAIDGTNKKTIFDFNGGGGTENLTVNNSTFYANPSNAQNGGFFSTQSGSKFKDQLGGTNWKHSLTNSTFYNITYGKTVSTLRENSQGWQVYEVKNCIVVNCGKKSQFVKGLNAGQNGRSENYDVDNNVFNFDGAVDAQQGADGANNGSIDAVVEFADPENGDFKQSTVTVGDPRWL